MWLCSSWAQANSQLWCLSMMHSSAFSSKNIMQGHGLGSQFPQCIYILLVAALWPWWMAKHSTSSSSWIFFSNVSNISYFILQKVGLCNLTCSQNKHPAQQTFLCTTLSLNNANGFFKRKKTSQNFRLGKEFSVFPCLHLGYVKGVQKKAQESNWLFQLRRTGWGWRKEGWVLEVL